MAVESHNHCLSADAAARGVCIMTEYLLDTMDNNNTHLTSDGDKPASVLWIEYWLSSMFYFRFCSLMSHVLLIGITIAVCRKCIEMKLVHTAEHALYCTIAFVLFVGEALLLRGKSSDGDWLSKPTVDLLHTILGLSAFAMGVYGVAVKTKQKLQRKQDDPNAVVLHFRTKHGFSGILGSVCLLLSVVTGLSLYFIDYKVLLLSHRFIGLSAFVLLMISQLMSYNTGFATRNWSRYHVKLFKFFTFIALIMTANYEFRRLVRDLANQFPADWFRSVSS